MNLRVYLGVGTAVTPHLWEEREEVTETEERREEDETELCSVT